ncbi:MULTISPECIES: dienelactone hydrolase family protein [unclassified Novosphingobium]|uniref:dienelactone hydrolase family protein n=1 Tax=Novosphingobium TaxID=165696 RepID=UPI001820EAD1|nr:MULTISPECIES: dienelactone hydrolase family protein [unclassified Novosphingobium]NMN05938.1 dienelactone hydrolase [Novosphingobium sp. SG919]NMN88234.1 dienelactone hydrolase [Novosphingobium sp. SG916]
MNLGRAIDYPAGSVTARGYLALPADGKAKGGVLVVHEAPGVGPHVRARAEALAGLGYAALAADLHGEGRLAASPPEARAWVDALKSDPDELIARMNGALDALVRHGHVGNGNLALAGYCFGGWCALELARSGAPVRSTSVFHGSLASARDATAIRGSVLVCSGDADPFVPAAQIAHFTDEMRAAGIDCQVSLYCGVAHGFTDRDVPAMPGFGYSPKADQRAWQTFLNLLAEHSAD